MSTKTAALLFGIVFAVVGVLGFMPAPPPPDAPPLAVEHGHGLALGMFPVNTLHNIVHLLFGVLGLAAWSGGWGRRYFQLVAVSYAVLTVFGMIPGANTTFGLIPLWGNDVWLHAVIAGASAYFGFVKGNVDMTHHTPAHGRV
jgi:hypothetical protein